LASTDRTAFPLRGDELADDNHLAITNFPEGSRVLPGNAHRSVSFFRNQCESDGQVAFNDMKVSGKCKYE